MSLCPKIFLSAVTILLAPEGKKNLDNIKLKLLAIKMISLEPIGASSPPSS